VLKKFFEPRTTRNTRKIQTVPPEAFGVRVFRNAIPKSFAFLATFSDGHFCKLFKIIWLRQRRAKYFAVLSVFYPLCHPSASRPTRFSLRGFPGKMQSQGNVCQGNGKKPSPDYSPDNHSPDFSGHSKLPLQSSLWLRLYRAVYFAVNSVSWKGVAVPTFDILY